jgi:uncharacterized membrane protein (GlpM family)
MKALEKRFILFLGGCIPMRLLFVWLAKIMPLNYLPYAGALALLPAFGFFYLFLTGKRTSGLETQGAPIWWSRFRIIHGFIYLGFAYYAFQRARFAYKFLLADVLLGLGLFIWHHYTSGSFAQLNKK